MTGEAGCHAEFQGGGDSWGMVEPKVWVGFHGTVTIHQPCLSLQETLPASLDIPRICHPNASLAPLGCPNPGLRPQSLNKAFDGRFHQLVKVLGPGKSQVSSTWAQTTGIQVSHLILLHLG